MTRETNIFYRIVRDENSATELLCNLMRYSAFRLALLEKLFPGSPYINSITHDDITTQTTLKENNGRPDLIISSRNVYAVIEVKVDLARGLTDNQPDGYAAHLFKNEANCSESWLSFLVPKGWEHCQFIKDKFEAIKAGAANNRVKTSIVYWDDILDLIEQNNLDELNPFFKDFHQLLASWYRPTPVKFTTTQIRMLFKKDIPQALASLDDVIDQILDKARGYRCYLKHSGKKLCPDEKGVYFQNQDGAEVFYFGTWTPFWKTEGYPLCYGVFNRYPTFDAFRIICPNAKEFKGWALAWVSEAVLESEKPVDAIWQELEPVLKTLVGPKSEEP